MYASWKIVLLVLFGCRILVHGSDPIPGAMPSQPVALVGGTIHGVDSKVIPDGVLIFERGKILALGSASEVTVPAGAQIVSVSGKHVYPSFIACCTQLGLVEIGAVRATRDQSESGTLNPNVRAEVSVNPDSEHLPVARANGVGLAQSVPTGGLLSGSSALLRLDGWTSEELVVEAPLGLHINWPSMSTNPRRGFRGPPPDKKAPDPREARDRQLRELDDAVELARSYHQTPEDRRVADLRSEAWLPVIRRQRPVFLHARTARDIEAGVSWASAHKLRVVVVSGSAAAEVASFLAQASVPVIYGPVHRLPSRRDLSFDEPFAAAARLSEAGVTFAIAGFETDNARNLPYHAATAAAYGLDPDEALRAITLYPARILGVEDRYGSLAVGKQASLFVANGDPLEITTQVEHLWLDGRPVDLSSRHTGLYEKYAERLRRQTTGPRF